MSCSYALPRLARYSRLCHAPCEAPWCWPITHRLREAISAEIPVSAEPYGKLPHVTTGRA